MDAEIAKQPTKYIRSPWLRQRTYHIDRRRFRVDVYGQPGRWMSDARLTALEETLREVSAGALETTPTYGVFSGQRAAFGNRVVAVVTERATGIPAAFTAMVYLPIVLQGRVEPILHLGLTMIQKRFRGRRIQRRLFEKAVYLPFFNQLKARFILTNIAASPAGIGSVADYFQDAYPHYRGSTERKAYHLEVARKVLRHYRHEFGCAETATLDPETFVVRGSNDPAAGGAWQLIGQDPVSRYKREACNEFCRRSLRYAEGDELFQVANMDIVSGTLGILRRLPTRRSVWRRAEVVHASG